MIWKFDKQSNFSKGQRLWTVEEMGYEFTEKPQEIPDSAVRRGTYYIRRRGGSYSYYDIYEYFRGEWMKRKAKLNRDFYDKTTWNLFPQLSDKEYQKLKSMFKYLSPRWQQNYLAYNHWLELRGAVRKVRLIRFKAIKK